MFQKFGHADFHLLCDTVAQQDKDLETIIKKYGYPPLWSRPNSFESLVHIILEQQVSLASALAALNKLKQKIKKITPANILLLTDDELRACYFSRQKTIYVRDLAKHILSGTLSLKKLALMEDEMVRKKLIAVKGIGNWTTDIYLIFILHHTDIFPAGDLAAVNALKKIKQMPVSCTKEDVVQLVQKWKPYRTIGTMLLWHNYLEDRKINKIPLPNFA